MNKKKFLFLLISVVIIVIFCQLHFVKKAHHVKIVGYYVSDYEINGYYPILTEVIIEYKFKEISTIIDELEKHNINCDEDCKVYLWDNSVSQDIINENKKRENWSIVTKDNFIFVNKLKEISLNTVIDRDLNILIKVKD